MFAIYARYAYEWRTTTRESDSVKTYNLACVGCVLIESGNSFSSTVILTALQTAIDTRSANLMTIALDCLGKFITYNYLADIEDEVAQSQVMERVVDSICESFIGEDTNEKVQLQIIKVTAMKEKGAWKTIIDLSDNLLDLARCCLLYEQPDSPEYSSQSSPHNLQYIFAITK